MVLLFFVFNFLCFVHDVYCSAEGICKIIRAYDSVHESGIEPQRLKCPRTE